ncbi:tyrosine-protein phosphatase [Mesorhizobium sp. CGMCC 1.15528]|uniref:Tyrosine-protein phosphatase n=1 Tax=Mesorhizobium zhangyense TaxID=1776730 RepID=A0A7C9VE41_9HYPH|nr:tyrosine-protein phosphatase [Mesorhizobium zhangyense]NGN43687.1 tyrosine-protein phosphatase [Mesorhizobium zhangyense]
MCHHGALFDTAARYRDAIDQCREPIATVMTAIAEADEGIVLLHCSAGKDRTGSIAALLLSLAGSTKCHFPALARR